MLLQNILRTMGVGAPTVPAWEDWDGSANGLASVFESAQSEYISACVLSDTKVLVAYRDNGNSYYGTAVVLTISGTTIISGTAFVFESAHSLYISACTLSDTKVLVAYRDYDSSSYGTAIILTISGTTITAGTPIVFESASSSYISACTLSDTKVLVAYCDVGNSNYGTAIVLTISGTTITKGTAFVFEGAESYYISACKLSDTKALVAYRDGGNSDYGTAVILTISGTTITAGTPVVFESAASTHISACKLSDTKALVAYRDGGNSNYGTAVVLNISGTTITKGTAFVFGSDSYYVSVCVLSDAKALVAYRNIGNSNYGTAVILTISGTTITAGTPVVFESAQSDYISACTLSDTKVLVAYCDAGNSSYGTAIVLQSNIAADKLYIEDVFATTLYTGTGAAKAVTTGVSLSGEADGLIWLKSRSAATDHALYDTVRGATYDLVSNSTAAQTTQTTGLTSFNADGFSIGTLAKLNTNAATYAAWTFKKRAKFFDVVTWTGNGVGNRVIPHGLGIKPGMVVIKCVGPGDWLVQHRAATNVGKAYPEIGGNIYLNYTDGCDTGTNPILSAWSESNITLSTNLKANSNAVGSTYVAYLWAHDDSADGVVQCGSFTGGSSVSTGWWPQLGLFKRTDSTGNWLMMDTARGWGSGNDLIISPNLSAAESSADYGAPTSTGFTTANLTGNYIYMVIRAEAA